MEDTFCFFISFPWWCSVVWLSSAYFMKRTNTWLLSYRWESSLQNWCCLLSESSFLIPLMMVVCREMKSQPEHWGFAVIQVALSFNSEIIWLHKAECPKGPLDVCWKSLVGLTGMGSFLWRCSRKKVSWDWKTNRDFFLVRCFIASLLSNILISLIPLKTHFWL